MTDLTPQAARRYRRAAAFLIHWRAADKDLGAEGAAEVLGDLGDDPGALTGVLCAVAELAWRMADEPDPGEYLRRVAAKAAVDEVSA
jgi:hypothetical protein